jgi:tetratricopeptide (TPR) repeat protein
MKQSELQELLKSLQHNLNILREREAKFGGNAPLDLLNQIADHQQAVKLVKSAIQGDMSPAELEAELSPLNLSFDRGDTEIVAGKNIIKIGNITVPALPVVIAVMVVLGVAAVLAWYFLVPDKMPLNTFNVAVADFGQVDAQGNVSSSEDGKNLSEWMFGEMESEYKNWPADRPVVWHDSMGFLQKQGNIGTVEGNSAEERQQAAQEIAERLGAQMVIFGNIAVDENPPSFIPEFYIADIENEADEIVGTHRLGSPIEVRLPLDLYDQRAGNFFEQNLGVRADALVWFTRGLALDLSGRHEDALAVFQEAETEEELSSWQPNQGRELLYYFMGRQALFLSLEQPEYLDEAEAAFKQALIINPAYPRGHIGLGGVYFQRAQHRHLQPEASPDDVAVEADLALALAEFEQAFEQSDSEVESQTKLKAILSLGFAYGLLGEVQLNAGDVGRAAQAYTQAVGYTEKAIALLPDNQHRLLAQAYLSLGATYEGQAYLARGADTTQAKSLYEAAQTAYAHCVAQAEAEFYDTTLQEIKTNYCAPYREDVQAILEDF